MRTNSFSPGAKFIETQEKVLARLTEKYANGRKIETDVLKEPIIWAKDVDDMIVLVKSFMIDPALKVDFLSDITAYDNIDKEDGEKRFVLVYQLYSLEQHTRIRVKCLVDENEEANTLTGIFSGANWLEREVYDMYGITFKGHPNLKRILMDERFTGFPLRKEYNIKQREPFNSNVEIQLSGPVKVDTHIKTSEEA